MLTRLQNHLELEPSDSIIIPPYYHKIYFKLFQRLET